MTLIVDLLPVVGVLALTVASAWFLRRRGFGLVRPGRRRLIEVIDRVPLNQQVSVQVVRAAGAEYVLAVSGSSVTVLERRQVDQ